MDLCVFVDEIDDCAKYSGGGLCNFRKFTLPGKSKKLLGKLKGKNMCLRLCSAALEVSMCG